MRSASSPFHPGRPRVRVALACCLALLFAACGNGGGLAGSAGGGALLPQTATFFVLDAAGFPVVGATVYLVPAADVDQSGIDGSDVLAGSSEDRDEPLEDAVRLNGVGYLQAVSDAAGQAVIPNVPDGKWFWLVIPAVADLEHLPGGSGCRTAWETTPLVSAPQTLIVSSQPGPAATYIGSTTCLVCHPSYGLFSTHAHKLGFAVPGSFGPLQNPVRYPDFQDGWSFFLPAATYAGGTPVYFSDYDAGRPGFDKFKTSLAPEGVVAIIAWLWKDGVDYKITLQNFINGADPNNFKELVVDLSYGGAVYKQIYMVSVSGAVPARKGRYPLLQYQTEGANDTPPRHYERTRRSFRDYNMYTFWNAAGPNLLVNPPVTATFEGNCTGCHSTGFTRFQDGVTGEWLSDAVDDTSGVIDIDGDTTLDEINIGCEVCHGPGSEHITWAAANPTMGARYIVYPHALSPSREMMICGRCHDRPLGNGPVVTEEPLNPAGFQARPGMSRMDFLASHVTRKGPALTDYWSDQVHSLSQHQQYSDLLKSTMHRNDRVLTVCTDCHNLHGYGPYEHHLTGDPDVYSSTLCWKCHLYDDLIAHMVTNTGSSHAGLSTTCVDCHVAKTPQSGSGTYGHLLGVPTGTVADDALIYYQNDLSSHLFGTVARKSLPDVAGQTPVDAMPIPYTKTCGQFCHNAAALPKPGVPLWLPLSHLKPADDEPAGR